MVEGKQERLLRRSLYQIRQCDPVKNSLIILSSFCHTGWEGQIPFWGSRVRHHRCRLREPGTFGEPEYFTQRIIFRCFCQAVAAATAPESGEKFILYQYL